VTRAVPDIDCFPRAVDVKPTADHGGKVEQADVSQFTQRE
jgi:hypothetical protein